ncbi:Protein of unknown function (DUF3040) [Amycolatopsis echigonensis]|uniref:DUF3040 family protein n=1 Tax=Amycolatopsis echigonensis TaxID=2576905 RepID=A0A2N3X1C7_9PSEU|nr:DUF3040 domain-containing protein [Amycolatopsis niigatensis]PKV99920.1 Protein of unknown function (DUF3040) [Amycolatopsis niigatensis]
MLSTEEQRTLRQIQHDPRRDDPWFGWHLAAMRLRALRRRRGARICLAIELAFLALVAVGIVPTLLVLTTLGAGLNVPLPIVALRQ